MKKFLNVLLTLIISIGMLSIPIRAESNGFENDKLELKYKNFIQTVDDYKASDVYAIYSESFDTEEYKVYSRKTNRLLATYTLETPMYTVNAVNPNAHTAYLTATKTIGDNVVNIIFTSCIQYYTSGSFRSYEAINYSNLSFGQCATVFRFDNTSASSWSHTGGFPCTQIDYSYTTNVVVDTSVNASINAELISVGFSGSAYNYLFVQSSGSFRCY